MLLHNIGSVVDVFFNEINNFAKNEAVLVMHFAYMTVTISDTLTVSENNVLHNIMELEYCDITFTKTVAFLSNRCLNVIYMISMNSPYITVMEHTNITFTNISYHGHLVYPSNGPIENNYLGVFPLCIFQYMLSTSDVYNFSELINLYTISFNDNVEYKHVSNYSYSAQMNNIYDFLTHCKWLPTAVFDGYNPEYINQQIVQVDGH